MSLFGAGTCFLGFIFTKDVFYTVSEVFTAVIWVSGSKMGSGHPGNP